MIRPFTCLSLIAALGAGLYLYQEKHRATLLDRDINRTVKLADQARDRTSQLKAEWALLNDTQRLSELAAHHLPTLQALLPAQYVRLEDLPGRLPAISAAPVQNAPTDDGPVAAAQPLPPPVPQVPAAPLMPLIATAPPAPPIKQAAVKAPAKPVQLAAAKPKPHDPQPTAIAQLPTPLPPLASMPQPAPRPYYAPVMPAYSPAPLVIHAPSVQTASISAPQPAPFVGSALGMARSLLAAPVPVASAATLGYLAGR